MLYFFSRAGAVSDADPVGVELDTISEARVEAVRFAAENLRDRPELAWLGDEFRVEVRDKDRVVLFTFVAFGVDSPVASGMPAAS